MTQYMLSYPIKTHNAMMDLNNIDKAVFHHRMHPEQLTLPKMFCGTILSIVSVAKKKCPVMYSHHCENRINVTPEHIKHCFISTF